MAYSTILLDNLITTQNGLRNYPQVRRMIRFVEEQGKFTRDARLAQSLLTDSHRGTPPPIHIARMKTDGLLVLHDGHHRAVAMMLGGRNYIDSSEYELVEYSYSDYLELHPEKGWFTPFDIRREVRLPEFGPFKKEAVEIYRQFGAEQLRNFVSKNRQRYVEERRVTTVKDLSQVYCLEAYDTNGRLRNACA